MDNLRPQYVLFANLMELSLEEFAIATRGIEPKPCIQGFDPESFLKKEPQLANSKVNDLQVWLETEYSDGRRIFNGWMLLAAIQSQSGGR